MNIPLMLWGKEIVRYSLCLAAALNLVMTPTPPNQGTIEEDKTLPMEVDQAEEQPLADDGEDGEDKAELLHMKKEVLQEQEVVATEQGPSSSSSVTRKKGLQIPIRSSFPPGTSWVQTDHEQE